MSSKFQIEAWLVLEIRWNLWTSPISDWFLWGQGSVGYFMNMHYNRILPMGMLDYELESMRYALHLFTEGHVPELQNFPWTDHFCVFDSIMLNSYFEPNLLREKFMMHLLQMQELSNKIDSPLSSCNRCLYMRAQSKISEVREFHRISKTNHASVWNLLLTNLMRYSICC